MLTTSKPDQKQDTFSDRIRRLREDNIKAQPEICPERAQIITRSYMQNEDKQINI
jgi:hypothetical protein